MSKWLDELEEEHTTALTGYTDGDAKITDYDTRVMDMFKLKQEILSHLDKVIGEDEDDDLNPMGMMARSAGRNTLRAELRKELGIEK